jgi:malonyl CoA-acyl carrier protein transacylase
MMVAFVFPGQGSQQRGMGRELFDEVEEYAHFEDEVDALLGYSARELCICGPDAKLSDTRYTQPCLYIVNALSYYKLHAQGVDPVCVAGHSLGEYNALLAAGVFDFMTGLKLVKRRGELMAEAPAGGMAAVIGLKPECIEEALRGSGIGTLDIANYNSPLQTVISGPKADLELAGPVLESAGATMFVPLRVSAAFHSRYMAEAGARFAQFLTSTSLRSPRIPVIANATGRPYPVRAEEKTAELLVKQITGPVKWTQSIQYLLDQGIGDYREVGPGAVLSRLIQQVRQAERTAALAAVR